MGINLKIAIAWDDVDDYLSCPRGLTKQNREAAQILTSKSSQILWLNTKSAEEKSGDMKINIGWPACRNRSVGLLESKLDGQNLRLSVPPVYALLDFTAPHRINYCSTSEPTLLHGRNISDLTLLTA